VAPTQGRSPVRKKKPEPGGTTRKPYEKTCQRPSARNKLGQMRNVFLQKGGGSHTVTVVRETGPSRRNAYRLLSSNVSTAEFAWETKTGCKKTRGEKKASGRKPKQSEQRLYEKNQKGGRARGTRREPPGTGREHRKSAVGAQETRAKETLA